MDTDKDGRIAFSEFIAVMREAEEKEEVELRDTLAEVQKVKRDVEELHHKEEDTSIEGAHQISAKLDKMVEQLGKQVTGKDAGKIFRAAADDWKKKSESDNSSKKKD